MSAYPVPTYYPDTGDEVDNRPITSLPLSLFFNPGLVCAQEGVGLFLSQYAHFLSDLVPLHFFYEK
jgi:hypothetical protein